MLRVALTSLSLVLLTVVANTSAFAQTQPKLGFEGIHNGRGIYVQSVDYNSLAEQMGLESGVVILTVNGQAINSDQDYLESLREAVSQNEGRIEIFAKNSRPFPATITVSGVIDSTYMVSHTDPSSY